MSNSKKFALLGHNIDYSLSPAVHGLIYEIFDLDASYELISADEEQLPQAILKLKSEFDGFNVTKPHKRNILPYLEQNNSPFGAVNTVINSGGKFIGFNTDVFGFQLHFSEACAGLMLSGKDALVIGAGGVSEIVVYSLKTMGANVTVVNRTKANALAISKKYGTMCGEYITESSAGVLPKSMLLPQIIVNCTSAGLSGEQALPVNVDLSKLLFAYDTIYSAKTPFLTSCEAAGAKISDGMGMLILQAIAAERFWFETKWTKPDILKAYDLIVKKLKYAGEKI